MATTTVVSKVVTEVATEKTAVDLTSIASTIDEFFATRDLINSLEKTKKELEDQIKTLLGKAEVGLVDGKIRLEVSTRERSGVDSKILQTTFPEAYEAALTTKPYVVLVAK